MFGFLSNSRFFFFSLFVVAITLPLNSSHAAFYATTGQIAIYKDGTNEQGIKNFDQDYDASGTSFLRTLRDLDPRISGAAKIKFTAKMDHGSSFENVFLRIDQQNLGTLFDHFPGNDIFSNSHFGDKGFNQIWAEANLDMGDLVDDRALDIYFKFGADIQIQRPDDYVELEISYATVPLPGTLVLFVPGLAMVGYAAMRRANART